MAALPQELPWHMADNRWASILNPIVANPANNSIILKNIELSVGTNVINHKLGRNLQGWQIIRKRASADIYDTQDTNQMPNLTLTLVSDAIVTIDLAVF